MVQKLLTDPSRLFVEREWIKKSEHVVTSFVTLADISLTIKDRLFMNT